MTINSEDEPVVKFMRAFSRTHNDIGQKEVLTAAKEKFVNRDESNLLSCYTLMTQSEPEARKQFEPRVLDLYTKDGALIRKGLRIQMAGDIALISDVPTGSLKFAIGDELRSANDVYRIVERIENHCAFGSLPAHFDVRVAKV
jgi:hypothetical protein